MTIIRNDRIIIDRGSDVDIPVCVVHAPEHPWSDPRVYDIQDNDVLTMRVYRSPRSDEAIMEFNGDPGSGTIKISGEDTEWMRTGRYYANIMIEHDPGIRKQIWPVEIPDDFGKVHKHYNFMVNAGEEVYA